jgi:hypothetical protein
MNMHSIKQKKYVAPAIQHIELDKEISLILQSNGTPTGEPGNWSSLQHPVNDPFRTVIS